MLKLSPEAIHMMLFFPESPELVQLDSDTLPRIFDDPVDVHKEKLIKQHLRKDNMIPKSEPMMFSTELLNPMSQVAVSMIAQVLGIDGILVNNTILGYLVALHNPSGAHFIQFDLPTFLSNVIHS